MGIIVALIMAFTSILIFAFGVVVVELIDRKTDIIERILTKLDAK